MKIKYQIKNGFTLIEILITVSILLVIIAMSSELIIKTFKAMTFSEEEETAIQNARQGITTMTKEIRAARLSDRGDYPLLTIDPQNFVFFCNADGGQDIERIQFKLVGSNLLRVVTASGAGHTYTGPYSTTTISQYVNNVALPIFKYYDSNNNQTNDIAQVRLINMYLKINVTPTIAPADIILETDINLRNLKSNL